jgi:hypothetical protein
VIAAVHRQRASTMKRIFIALGLAFALTGAMLVTTVLGYFG